MPIVNTTLLLPHMDDEVFILPYLVDLSRDSTNSVQIIYLTKSEGRNNRFSSKVRANESLRMIRKILPNASVTFLGDELGIEDLALHERISIVEKSVLEILDPNCEKIIAPHFEGGHLDHDSANFLAFKIAIQKSIKLVTFNLYSARHHKNTFYKVAKPTVGNEMIHARARYSLKSLKHLIQIPFVYKSQFRTWVGIFPALFWRVAFRNKVLLFEIQSVQHEIAPNNGKILYENRKDGSFQQWLKSIGI